MTVRVLESQFFVHNMRTRFPFHYGIASMTTLPHLFVRLLVEVDGVAQWGIAADGLAPKWFTKDPDQDYRDELNEMLTVIDHAAEAAKQIGSEESVFELWHRVYCAQCAWAHEHGYPALLWNFGVSLVERAVLDAFCRITGIPFALALRTDALGIRLGRVDGDLAGCELVDLLPAKAQRTVLARHTVGLSDPLKDCDIADEDRVDDGLPQSFESCIRAYGLNHFKLKINGTIEQDRERLTQIAAVIEENVGSDYHFTLDGNEQYSEMAAFRTLWEELATDASLASFMERLIFVEQPLNRQVALDNTTKAEIAAWPDRPPIIIDESGSSLCSLPQALECGYVGTSHKNCKGVLKGVINACRLAHRRQIAPDSPAILSGEDLSNVGPVALIQDLAVAASLGITHVERNGHHYFRGLSMYDETLQEEMLIHHADLYHRHTDGFTAVNVQHGALEIGSVVDAPFGLAFEFDPSQFTPLRSWQFESLDNVGIRTKQV